MTDMTPEQMDLAVARAMGMDANTLAILESGVGGEPYSPMTNDADAMPLIPWLVERGCEVRIRKNDVEIFRRGAWKIWIAISYYADHPTKAQAIRTCLCRAVKAVAAIGEE